MSKREWDQLDEPSRMQYLAALIETAPPRADDWAYESYELAFEPVSVPRHEQVFTSTWPFWAF